MNVAQIIYQQLGGAKLVAMTGAKNFLSTDDSLSFQLPRAAKDKIKYVKITLNSNDTYTIVFSSYNQRTFAYTVVKTVDRIYGCNLQSVVSSVTGLALSIK